MRVYYKKALWSALNSTGPWKRVTTLRNGSHIDTLCGSNKRKACSIKAATCSQPCAVPCGASCCSGSKEESSFVTWAPTLIHAPSTVNASGTCSGEYWYITFAHSLDP